MGHRAHASFSFFTADLRLSQKQQPPGFWQSASCLEYTFEAIPGTYGPQESHNLRSLGFV